MGTRLRRRILRHMHPPQVYGLSEARVNTRERVNGRGGGCIATGQLCREWGENGKSRIVGNIGFLLNFTVP